MGKATCEGLLKETALVECMNCSANLSNLLLGQAEEVVKIMMARDAHVLHDKLEALTNPPRSLAPNGKTTAL